MCRVTKVAQLAKDSERASYEHPYVTALKKKKKKNIQRKKSPAPQQSPIPQLGYFRGWGQCAIAFLPPARAASPAAPPRCRRPCGAGCYLFPAQLFARVANRGGSGGPGPRLVLSSKCDSSPDRGIIGNRWLTLLICGLKLQTEFQESSGVINGNRESHTQPNQYVVVVG